MSGMKQRVLALAVAISFLALPAMAGSRDAEAETLIDKAALDQSVLMLCSAPTPQDLDTMQMAWSLNLQRRVRPALATLDVGMEALMRIMAKTSLDNLTAKTAGPKEELTAFCGGNAEVLKRVTAPDYADPTAELEKLLK
jgi:hypothetical protein